MTDIHQSNKKPWALSPQTQTPPHRIAVFAQIRLMSLTQFMITEQLACAVFINHVLTSHAEPVRILKL